MMNAMKKDLVMEKGAAGLRVLPDSKAETVVIRVRDYLGNAYLATTPNQGVYRSSLSAAGFEPAVNAILERHWKGRQTHVRRIEANDPRVTALGVKLDRHDAAAKETRWFLASIGGR